MTTRDDITVVYLSGPMTGLPDFNFPKFTEAAERLRGAGYRVWSPHERDLENGFDPAAGSLEGFDLHEAMRDDLSRIVTYADAIVLLPGWGPSRGAKLERFVAESCGIPAFLYDPLDGTCLTPAPPWPAYITTGFDSAVSASTMNNYVVGTWPGGDWRMVGTVQPAQGEAEAHADSESICEEADRIVSGDRRDDYGHPLDNFDQTARLWSALLGTEVTAEQVGLCMVAVKLSRATNRITRDTLVDICGYAKCVDLTMTERVRRQAEQ